MAKIPDEINVLMMSTMCSSDNDNENSARIADWARHCRRDVKSYVCACACVCVCAYPKSHAHVDAATIAFTASITAKKKDINTTSMYLAKC